MVNLCPLTVIRLLKSQRLGMTIHTHPDSIYAGALGAALWGGFRHRVLERRAVEAGNREAP